MLIKYRQQSRGVDIYSTLTTKITLQEISFLKLCYFSFFTFSFPVHSAFHIKLYIQQNKALRFQEISRINAFSIATIIQCKSPWGVLQSQKQTLKFNRPWLLIPMNIIIDHFCHLRTADFDLPPDAKWKAQWLWKVANRNSKGRKWQERPSKWTLLLLLLISDDYTNLGH